MPDLPTFSVTNQAVYDRIVAAFDGDPAIYRAWLKDQVKKYVIDRELKVLQDENIAEQNARAAEIQQLIDTGT